MFDPTFKGEIEGYTVNYLAKNHWKVKSTVPWDDCMQEAQVIFLRCKRKYTEVSEPAHFMALYKTAWHNNFLDLANENTAYRENVSIGGEDESPDRHRAGETDNDGALATMIRQAPREIQMVLSLFLSAPQELLDVALAGWRGKDRRMRSGGSKRVNQMLGLPEDRDTLQEVEDYFTR